MQLNNAGLCAGKEPGMVATPTHRCQSLNLRSSITRLRVQLNSDSCAVASHNVAGLKLHVIQQTDGHYLAISKQRQLGLIAINLPLGVLLATFNRALHPAAALAAVQGALRTGPSHTQYTPSHPAGAVAAAAASASAVSTYS